MRILLSQDWSEYARFVPDGWRALGVVDAGNGDLGALVQRPDATYLQLNGALIRTLDQRQVHSLVAGALS
jgi:hypothetical protein